MSDFTITNSELRCFQLCKRKWYLAYGLGYAPDPASEPVTGVVHLGSSIHLALEGYYGYGIDAVQALSCIYTEDVCRYPGEQAALEKEFELAKVMTTGYLDWAAAEGIDAAVEIIGTEVTVEHSLEIAEHQITLRGKLDQLARRKSDGSLIARDLKTVGSLGKAQQLRYSSQLKFYALIQAMEAKRAGAGEVVAGGEYLLIARSKRTSRATPPFYERVEVPLNRFDLASEWAKTQEIIIEILEARKRLRSGEDHHSVVYAHQGDWCSWQCAFKDVCPMFDDGSRAYELMQATFIKYDSLAYYRTDKIDLLRAALA